MAQEKVELKLLRLTSNYALIFENFVDELIPWIKNMHMKYAGPHKI